MKYSHTALKELSKRYRNILIKCAMLNIAVLAMSTSAFADVNITEFNQAYKNVYAGIFKTATDSAYVAEDKVISITPETVSLIDETVDPIVRGVQSRFGGNITLGGTDTESINITSKQQAVISQGTGSIINLEAKNIVLTSTESTSAETATVIAQNTTSDATENFATLNIKGENISIKGNRVAVSAMSQGILNITGNTTIEGGEEAILARGKTTVISINADNENYTTKINGNISFDYHDGNSRDYIDATVNLALNGADSYWTGNILRDWDGGLESTDEKLVITNGVKMTLNEGASWTATEIDSTIPPEQVAVTSLTVNKGTINSSNGNAYVKNATINGDLTLNGTLTTVAGGTINFAEGSTLTTTLDASTVKFTGDGEVKGTINLTSLSAGTYAFMGADVNHASLTFANNSLYDIALEGDELVVKAKSTENIAKETGAKAEDATKVLAIVSADGTGTEKGSQLASLISETMQSGNAQVAVEAAKQAAPTTAQVVAGIAKEASNTIAKLSTNRLDAIKGRSGGDMSEGAGLWVQALYNHTKQDATSSSDGFKANSRGLALGVDKEITDRTTLGLGYGYMNTDADSYGRDLEVDGHNFFIYGKYQPSKWYVSSVLNYNYSKYTEKKSPLGVSLRSEYDVNSYGAQLMTGYDMDNGFTPEAGLRYLIVDADSYDDGMQRIRSEKDDILTAVAGIKYSTKVKSEGVVFKPTVRLAATYDVISDNSRANVSVIGGSNYSVDGARLHRFGVEAGAGVTASVDNVDITLEYAGSFRQDYRSQGGMLRARYNF